MLKNHITGRGCDSLMVILDSVAMQQSNGKLQVEGETLFFRAGRIVAGNWQHVFGHVINIGDANDGLIDWAWRCTPGSTSSPTCDVEVGIAMMSVLLSKTEEALA